MGLDNGFIIKSNRRELTRQDLPAGISYPFEKDYTNGIEIIYHRKDWGWRNSIMKTFGWYNDLLTQGEFIIDKPVQILTLIELTAQWLDEMRWENEGQSIWEYDEIRPILIRDISNLAILYGFMLNNPDVVVEFYDSF